MSQDDPRTAFAFKFDGHESLHPYWEVHRMSQSELKKLNVARPQSRRQFNMAVMEKQYNVVTVGRSAGDASLALTYNVLVSCLTNDKPVKQGEELVIEIADKVQPLPKKRGWKDDYNEAEAKRRLENVEHVNQCKLKKIRSRGRCCGVINYRSCGWCGGGNPVTLPH